MVIKLIHKKTQMQKQTHMTSLFAFLFHKPKIIVTLRKSYFAQLMLATLFLIVLLFMYLFNKAASETENTTALTTFWELLLFTIIAPLLIPSPSMEEITILLFI